MDTRPVGRAAGASHAPGALVVMTKKSGSDLSSVGRYQSMPVPVHRNSGIMARLQWRVYLL